MVFGRKIPGVLMKKIQEKEKTKTKPITKNDRKGSNVFKYTRKVPKVFK